jgi:hypothetical protein
MLMAPWWLMAPWLCMSAMVAVAIAVRSIPRDLSALFMVLFCLAALWQVESTTPPKSVETMVEKATKDDPMVAWWRRVMGRK